MEVLSVLFLLAVVSAHLSGRHHRKPMRRGRGRFADMLTRAARAFWDFNAANVALWERYLQAQRPWEWLHWVPTSEGWRLEGSKLPPLADRLQSRQEGDR